MSARGSVTLAAVCGERWPRLMTPALAAAYCGMLLKEWRGTCFGRLVRRFDGLERVDRAELDEAIDAARGEKKGKRNE